MHYRAFFFSCLIALPLYAATDCPTELQEALKRGSHKVVSGFSKSGLISELQALQVQKFQDGYLYRATFYPFWVFDYPDSLAAILKAIRLSELSEEEVQAEYFARIEDLVQQWEKDYVAAGGEVSKLWNKDAAKAFARRFYLELAYSEMVKAGWDSEQQPPSFTRAEADSPLSILAAIANLSGAFKDIDTFETAAVEFARSKAHVRTPRPATAPNNPSRRVRRTLRELGATPSGHPHRKADQKERDRKEIIESALRALDLRGSSGAWLVAMMKETSDTSDNPQFQVRGTEEFDQVSAAFGSFDRFIDALNSERIRSEKELVTLPPGVRFWEEEYLIQAGVEHLVNGSNLDLFRPTRLFMRRARTSLALLIDKIQRRR